MAISEEEVRKSFARVKEDITQVKRSLNKQLFSAESLQKSLDAALGKEEFYAFVKRLGLRIESLEDSFSLKSDKKDVAVLVSDLREEISRLRQFSEKRDEVADELRQARMLRGKVLELEGLAVQRAEFSRESAKVRSDVAALKSSLASRASEVSSLSESVSKLTGSLAELEGKANSLSANAVQKEEIASFTARIESSTREAARSFATLKRDVDKRIAILESVEERLLSFSDRLSATEGGLSGLQESIQKKSVDRASFEKAISDLKAQLAETRQLLESSMSTVNLDDYVTKRSLKQQLAQVSDSVGKLAGVEASVASIAEKVNAQKDFEKRFAEAKELKKLREDFSRLDSRFLSSDEFYSKLERVEGLSSQASDDFRKELKKQRELFEERLKSLESHYRGENDSLKSEISELKSHFKSLSKAGEQAKVEMAKITVSAQKAAAKTASDILEEVERESPKRNGNGKGLSPLAVTVVIVALLLIGSIAYVALKGPGQQQAGPVENETVPVVPVVPIEPEESPSPDVESEPVQPAPDLTSPTPAPNVTLPLPRENVTQPVLSSSNETNVSVPEALDPDSECRRKLECTKRSEREFWFDCSFDRAINDCRCFVGSIEDCPKLLVENESEQNLTGEVEEATEPRSPGARYYGIVAFIIAAVAFLAYRALFVKEGKDAGEHKAEAPEKKEKKAPERKEPAKEAKEEEEDKDVIDLEEFFEKKETKKK
ncbi:hypothetical protein HYU18_02395 [Candidatus Woesearchaeota archaeon]|nr:hypothetical protein [Candidatus Woesearchaeota archaeon]